MEALASVKERKRMNVKKNVWAALAASTILAAPALATADTTTYVPEDEIKDLRSVMTVVGGDVVYSEN